MPIPRVLLRIEPTVILRRGPFSLPSHLTVHVLGDM